jgi:chorismate mutase-like protein
VSHQLDEFRQQIDTLDQIIADALGKRMAVCKQVARYKGSSGIPMMQPDRVRQILDRCEAKALDHSLRPAFLQDLYRLIIKESCRLESDILQDHTGDDFEF